jgi:hypothetical protein
VLRTETAALCTVFLLIQIMFICNYYLKMSTVTNKKQYVHGRFTRMTIAGMIWSTTRELVQNLPPVGVTPECLAVAYRSGLPFLPCS